MVPLKVLRLATTRSTARQVQIRSPGIASSIRSLHQAPHRRLPSNDSEDRNSIDTSRSENTKSGTDSGVAKEGDAAFDPSETRPEKEMQKAGEGNEEDGNPLEVSPANPEVSKQRPQQEGGAEKSPPRDSASGGKHSGHGSPNKAKKV